MASRPHNFTHRYSGPGGHDGEYVTTCSHCGEPENTTEVCAVDDRLPERLEGWECPHEAFLSFCKEPSCAELRNAILFELAAAAAREREEARQKAYKAGWLSGSNHEATACPEIIHMRRERVGKPLDGLPTLACSKGTT